MKNSEYWKKRFQALEEGQHQRGEEYYKDLQNQFRIAQNSITLDIGRWYQRIADNNGISLASAKKLLKNDELEEFRWNVGQYIKAGEENAVNQRWMRQLENASARYHISYLESMKLQMQQHCELLSAKYHGGITDFLGKEYAEGFYHTAFEVQKGKGVYTNLAKLDTKSIDTVLTKPWAVDGKNFSDRIWTNKEKLVRELHRELSQCLIRGSDPQKAIDNIAKIMNVSKAQAGTLVMTELAAIHSKSKLDSFRELGVEEYEIVATLDNITSEICQDMDGRHFKLSDFEVGATAPPFHPNCRTDTVPVFGDEFDNIGERAARDEDGKVYYVPADMTYQKWKETFVDGGDKTGLQKGAVTVGKVKDAASAVSDIKAYYFNNQGSGRQAFAQGVLSAMDIKNVPVNVIPMKEWGYCRLNIQNGNLNILDYNLNANDGRGKDYQVKTAFHEAYHAKANGMKTDYGNIPQNKWLDIEETFAESSAHYMAGQIGIIDIAPAYPDRLVNILPRLKQLPEYALCSTIADFGKIAFEKRMAGSPPEWGTLYKQVMMVPHDWQAYAKRYFNEIRGNVDDYIDKMLENMPKYKQYRLDMKDDLTNAMQKVDNGKTLSSNEKLVLRSVLSIAMNRLGVR